jgi:hypothetical protein
LIDSLVSWPLTVLDRAIGNTGPHGALENAE